MKFNQWSSFEKHVFNRQKFDNVGPAGRLNK